MYTESMTDIGYYLMGDLEEVRAKLGDAWRTGRVDAEGTISFANANIGLYTDTEWASKEELESLLGVSLTDEEDLEFSDDFSFLQTPIMI